MSRIAAVLAFLAVLMAAPRPAAPANAGGSIAIGPAAAAPVGDQASKPTDASLTLLGTSEGLYRLGARGFVPLLSGTAIRRIEAGAAGVYVLCDEGILFSSDLARFERRDEGLPDRTIEAWDGRRASFSTETRLTDLAVDPFDGLTLAACDDERAWLSRDGGRSWKPLGAPHSARSGLKAIAVSSKPRLTVYASHASLGLFYTEPESAPGAWRPRNSGLARQDGASMVDEVSDISLAPGVAGGIETYELWVAQSFRDAVYRFDPRADSFKRVWGSGGAGGVASLDSGAGACYFVTELGTISVPGNAPDPGMGALLASLADPRLGNPECLFDAGGRPFPVSLNELWQLFPPSRAMTGARRRHGLYLREGGGRTPSARAQAMGELARLGLDMAVIDVKDERGTLRFSPRSPELAPFPVADEPLDLEAIRAGFANVWLVARIPVFKDEALWREEGGKFAIRDSATGLPWRATRKDGEGRDAPLDEYWVDPYCERAWERAVAVAREAVDRGFDEVQFDYVRFPTDGGGMERADYSWRKEGMDRVSALVSFLRHANSRIDAPISIDVFGLNGWYRSPGPTAQALERLAREVDVVCPMFYPSHFEQDFLSGDPARLRPYRIYAIGSGRAARIARGAAAVRPYVQAFYLDVDYDRGYYGPDYVALEVAGIRDSVDQGLTFWNNAGRYGDVTPIDPD